MVWKYILLIFVIIILLGLKRSKIERFNNTLFWDEVYLLNIPRLQKRRNYMMEQFKKNNINAKIHYGVDKKNIDMDFLLNLKKEGKVTDEYIESIKRKKKGSLACLLTHVSLWEKLRSSDKNNFLIFEDDCYLKNNFINLARDNLKYVPDDWDMIWLGHGKLKGEKINERVLVPENNPGIGKNALHHCYMIKKTSIPKFLKIFYPMKKNLPKDSIIRKNFDKFNAYFIINSLASQDKKTFSKSDRMS